MENRIQEIFQKQKANHLKIGKTSVEERRVKLLRLKEALLKRRSEIHRAIYLDYRKAAVEIDVSEIYPTVAEIDFALKNLRKWMKAVRVGNPFLMLTSHSQIHYESKGVVLIIGPWNYPLSLVLVPLVSAIAAGNCAIIKPSELTAHTSRLVCELLQSCFSEEEVAVVEGGPEVSTELLKLPLDHVFFTGSTRVGQIVMEAAAKNLTPVTLELGGKSPAIVEESASMATAASSIVWGKSFNAGQTCIAPDYVMLPENQLAEFLNFARIALNRIYGEKESDREKSADYCRIVNLAHYQRLKKLVEEAKAAGAEIQEGGRFKDSELYIGPTLLTGVLPHHPIMAEEIFGPVLPILTYRSLDEVFELIQSKDKPLALYIFSTDKAQIQNILQNTRAGGTCINSTLVHIANPNLPFGGTGQSGIGSYHGYFGFKTFSHERAILRQGIFNSVRLLYPPYGKRQKQLIDLSIRYFTH